MPFDPYEAWLGIPADRRPPTHYDLLGLEMFESDVAKIEQAALRRMAKVRQYHIGPHSELSQEILTELARARLILMDQDRREHYDAKVRARAEETTGKPVGTTGTGDEDLLRSQLAAVDTSSTSFDFTVLTSASHKSTGLRSVARQRALSWPKWLFRVAFVASHAAVLWAFFEFGPSLTRWWTRRTGDQQTLRPPARNATSTNQAPPQKKQLARAGSGPQTPPRVGPVPSRIGPQPRPPLDRNSAERLARARAAQGDWKGAARAYAQMFQIQPIDNGEPGFESAAVLLLAGDTAGYRRRCAELLERSGTAGIRGYHVARACTLAPHSVNDFAVPTQKSADELKGSREFWSLTEQGALACRAGRYDEAARLLEESLEADTRPGTAVLNWLWLALVNGHLGKPEEARAWLEKARTFMNHVSADGTTMPADADGLHMHNWLEALILRKEAESRLRK